MVAAPVPFDMEADRTDPPSGKSRADCVLPDMPPGDPPLQDTAITFRQDCEHQFAKAGLLGVAKGEWPARADAVEQNFPLHMLPPLAPTASAKEVQDRIAIQIRNDRNDRLRLMYLMEDRTTVFTCIYERARKHHKQFATDLITWCDLSASGPFSKSHWINAGTWPLIHPSHDQLWKRNLGRNPKHCRPLMKTPPKTAVSPRLRKHTTQQAGCAR